MPSQQTMSVRVHTGDYRRKARVLGGRNTWSSKIWMALFGFIVGLIVVLVMSGGAHA